MDRGESGAAMVCAECFVAKGESGESKLPCPNPRCLFYMRSIQTDADVVSLSLSLSNDLTFGGRRVSRDYDRTKRPSYTADFLRTSSQKDNVWGYHPDTTTTKGLYLQPPQSSSIFTSTGIGQKVRSQSISEARKSSYNNFVADSGKTKLMRARMLSMPLGLDPLLDYDSDLVEDAFLSSPLPDLCGDSEEDRRRYTPESDSGIGSPYGRPPSIFDWMESRQTQGIPSTYISAADTFSMGAVKTETTRSSVSLSSTGSSSDRASPGANLLSRRFLPSPNSFPTENYSKKVFIGGLPPDIDEDDIRVFFLRFGSVTVDWPHKIHSKACVPPKGYAFLLFKEETSVHKLLISCLSEGDKFFIYIPTGTLNRKKVQVRPWHVADSQYTVGNSVPLDSRKAVFVGGVPRPLKASELAEVMNEKYGKVAFVAIDCDVELKYPKGAACVVFFSHASYIAAVSARFMQLNYGSLDKKIEIKPYVLDGQMCDECHGVQCNGKPAPFFCSSVTCLQYYCEHCWATIHSMPGKQNHRPLLKDVGAKFY